MPPDFIETFSGKAFRPLTPNVDDICIKDIAHALSNQCRFSGHTKTFYSVAEHCVRVSQLLDVWGESPSTILWGLLHDASEAYLVDIPTPLKRTPEFAPYRAAEARLMGSICERFRMSPSQPKIVYKADAALLATEARDQMPFKVEHWGALTEEPLSQRITPWASDEAERCFLIRFASFYGRVS